MAPPLKVTEFDIYYGKGVDMYGSLLDLGFMSGLFTQKGAWIYYKGEMFSQGRDNAISKLKEDQETYNQITQEIEDAI
jgi:recombination protein RecA